MILLDLIFSLLVVIWQGNENQGELDIRDWKVVVPQVRLQFRDGKLL